MLTEVDKLFRLQKYKKFESNSQLQKCRAAVVSSCFDCKSTKNLRAIHNFLLVHPLRAVVVSTAKVQKIWEQFTTWLHGTNMQSKLFRLQKYKKFESNSQHPPPSLSCTIRCFDCKSTKNLRAIHNSTLLATSSAIVVSTAKVQKIWEQFTTRVLATR